MVDFAAEWAKLQREEESLRVRREFLEDLEARYPVRPTTVIPDVSSPLKPVPPESAVTPLEHARRTIDSLVREFAEKQAGAFFMRDVITYVLSIRPDVAKQSIRGKCYSLVEAGVFEKVGEAQFRLVRHDLAE